LTLPLVKALLLSVRGPLASRAGKRPSSRPPVGGHSSVRARAGAILSLTQTQAGRHAVKKSSLWSPRTGQNTVKLCTAKAAAPFSRLHNSYSVQFWQVSKGANPGVEGPAVGRLRPRPRYELSPLSVNAPIKAALAPRKGGLAPLCGLSPAKTRPAVGAIGAGAFRPCSLPPPRGPRSVSFPAEEPRRPKFIPPKTLTTGPNSLTLYL
jgi:hypothetical protein